MSNQSARIVEGFRLPADPTLTANEKDWLDLLRLIFENAVPPPTPAMRLRLVAKVRDLRQTL